MLLSHRNPLQSPPIYHYFDERSKQIASWLGSRFRGATRRWNHQKTLPTPNFRKHPRSSHSSVLSYESLDSKLAKRASPTMLYQAPSHRSYAVICYTFGVLLVSVAGYNFESQYDLPSDDSPTWIPTSIAAGSFMIACFGFKMLFKVARNSIIDHDFS